MRHGSLFSGIGGFDLAARWMGWENVFHSEIDPFCLSILKYHFPDAITYTDIRNTDFTPWRGNIDVLSGGFPCFAAGTLVLTESGLKPIEDIRAGEKVYSKNGRLCMVNAAMRNEVENIVSIKAQGIATPLRTTTNHPFWVKKRRKYWKPMPEKHSEAQWVDAGDIEKGDMIAYRCIEGNLHYRTPEFWYMVGYYLGNGWILDGKERSRIPQGRRGSRVNSHKWQVALCCNKNKREYLRKIITDAGYHATLSEERTTYKFLICSKELVSFLYDFGRYAHGKKLSGLCFELANSHKRALFEGWRDADGYITSNGTYRVTTVSNELAYGMAQIARDVYRRPVSVKKCLPNRECYIEGRRVNERPQIHVSVSPNSRYGYYEDGFLWCLVKQVEKNAQTTTVYNIAVEEDETYLTYGITVHNCQPFSQAGKRKGTDDARHLWPEMLRAVREIRPGWVVGENVLGITNWDGGVVFEQVHTDLEAEGYSVQTFVLPACGVGAPHQRYRTWFIAHRNDDELFAGLPLPKQIWAAIAPDGGAVDDADRDGDRGAQRGVPSAAQGDEESLGAHDRPAGESRRADTIADERRDADRHVRHDTGEGGELRPRGGSSADPDVVRPQDLPATGDGANDNPRERRDVHGGTSHVGPERTAPDAPAARLEGEVDSGEPQGARPCDFVRESTAGCGVRGTASDPIGGQCEERHIEGCGARRAHRPEDSAGQNHRASRHGDTTDAADADSQMPQCGDDEGAERRDFERFGVESFGGTFSWAGFPTVSPVLRGDDGLSELLHGIAFPRWRKESIKAYGNSILPQLAYRLFRVIEFMSNGK